MKNNSSTIHFASLIQKHAHYNPTDMTIIETPSQKNSTFNPQNSLKNINTHRNSKLNLTGIFTNNGGGSGEAQSFRQYLQNSPGFNTTKIKDQSPSFNNMIFQAEQATSRHSGLKQYTGRDSPKIFDTNKGTTDRQKIVSTIVS